MVQPTDETHIAFLRSVDRLLGAAHRAARPGLPDGSSEQGQYVAHWVDEDSGPHEVCMSAASDQEVRDILEPMIGSNTLTIRKVS